MMPARTKFGTWALVALAVAMALSFPPSASADLACVPGHNTVVPPCTFDNNVLSLDSAAGIGGGGGGHHTLVDFIGPTITIEADVAGGFPPNMATDNPTTGMSVLGSPSRFRRSVVRL